MVLLTDRLSRKWELLSQPVCRQTDWILGMETKGSGVSWGFQHKSHCTEGGQWSQRPWGPGSALWAGDSAGTVLSAPPWSLPWRAQAWVPAEKLFWLLGSWIFPSEPLQGALCNDRTLSYDCRGQTDPRFLLFSLTTNFTVPWYSLNVKLTV